MARAKPGQPGVPALPMRLDRWLVAQRAGARARRPASRNSIRSPALVRVNGIRGTGQDALPRPGDAVQLWMPPTGTPLPYLLPEACPLDCALRRRPPDRAQQAGRADRAPAPGNRDGNLGERTAAPLPEPCRGIGGERRPGIVHRLDRNHRLHRGSQKPGSPGETARCRSRSGSVYSAAI